MPIPDRPTPSPWSPPPPPRKRGSVWIWLVLGAVLLTGLVTFLAASFPDALDAEESRMRLTYQVLLLALLGGSLMLRLRARPGGTLRDAAIWVGIGLVVLLGYSLRHEFSDLGVRMKAELLPHAGRIDGETMVITARRGGSFVVEAEVDGVGLMMLVDTGASDVILTLKDAEKLGFDISRLSFDKPYRTANGPIMGAPVRLGRVAVGPVELTDVRASVNAGQLDMSLLGMSFLGRIKGYNVSGDRLTLQR